MSRSATIESQSGDCQVQGLQDRPGNGKRKTDQGSRALQGSTANQLIAASMEAPGDPTSCSPFLVPHPVTLLLFDDFFPPPFYFIPFPRLPTVLVVTVPLRWKC